MRRFKQATAVALSAAMVMTSVFTTNVSAGAKTKKAVKSVKVTNVKGNKLTLIEKKSFTLKTKVTVTGKASKKITFKTSNKKAATVSSNGVIKAVKAGKAKISVISKFDKKKKAVVNVTVKKATVKPTPASDTTDKFYACSNKYTEDDVVFKDDFNGKKLDRTKWNVETHEPGWVNNELQKYVDSEKNIYVKDGNLVIQALKDKNGNYTSGRVNTQNKVDYKYGRFEARLKMPKGQGFLPAFWMMPTNESLYGQWPKCGEIDIAEVLGNDTKTAYSTLHFGEPHKELQDKITLDKGDFYSQYHTYTCEWEPGKISFYVDGVFVHEENNWYSKKDGFDELTYPAPFDQPFYVILNLAVGGNWPGNPDKTTTFDEKARMVVNYVKIYHKGDETYKEADENAQRPAQEEGKYKEADSTGNYITNGDFSDSTDKLDDDNKWKFITAGTGKATAETKDKELVIKTEDAGNLDYSVQMIQSYMPIRKGTEYKLSFDAYADEARKMITDVSAPENGWIRYLPDTPVNLTKEKQHFEYIFKAEKYNDPYGRVEFNLGNQGSTATVHITNVRLEKVGTFEVSNTLPDGNYVINGTFDQGNEAGNKRMSNWTVTNNCNATVGVTNENNVRELKAVVPSGVKELKDLTVAQKNITIKPGTKYALTFDARADKAASIKAALAGKEFEAKLTDKTQNFKFSFTSDKEAFDAADKVLTFLLGTEGTIYIDNVRVQEDALITNGDFSNGETGFEVFADSSISSGVTHIIENQQEDTDNAMEVTIKDTGDADWKVQLKQDNITLKKEQWYTFSFDAKCNVDRTIKYAFQRDGSDHKNAEGGEDWTQYSGDDNNTANLTSTFKTFTKTFQMKEDTDPETILSFSLGAVNGKQITKEHKIAIDNIKLVETTDPAANLLKDSKFEKDGSWGASYYGEGGAEGTYTLKDGVDTFDIKKVGTDEWHVQLKQSNIEFEDGCTYKLTLNAKSSAVRDIKVGLMDPDNGYKWYGGTQVSLKANEVTPIEFVTDPVTASSKTIEFSVSMGQIKDAESAAALITLSDLSLVKVTK